MRRLVALVAVLACGTAHAEENRLLARARVEVDALELDAAKRTLQEALAAGTTSPADTEAIHLLSGEVAASMGNLAEAEQHFRRALSLDPAARLAQNTSPKIARPFEAARAWVEKAGPLKVSLDRSQPDVAILIVEHDPLRLVVGGRARWRDHRGLDHDQQASGPNRTRLAVPSDVTVVVTAVDARGNALAEVTIDASMRPAIAGSAVAPTNESAATGSRRGRWRLWGAAALVFAGVAGGFAIDGFIIDRRIDARNEASNTIEFHDVAPLENRVRRDVIVAQVGFGLALGCTAAAVLLAFRSSTTSPVAALVPIPGGLGMTGSWAFP